MQANVTEYPLLTPDQLACVANGCGPKFGRMERFVPDFDILKPACLKHDWLYWSGGDERTRNQADRIFYQDLKEIIAAQSFWKHLALVWVPFVYYSVVNRYGMTAFHYTDKQRTRADIGECDA